MPDFAFFSCRRSFRFNRQGAEKGKGGMTLAVGVMPSSSCYKKEITEYDTQYGDIVFAPDDLDENDPFEELPS